MIDVVYVRFGSDGKRLAVLVRRGKGEERGLVFVRTWSPQRGVLRRERAIPKEDLRGKPRKTEPQIAAIETAIRNEQRGR